MTGEHYVYTHLNPTTKEIFYVGCGKGHRVIDGGRFRNWKWKEYVYANNGYLFNVIAENLEKKEALKIERALIKSIGIENLCNIVGELGNATAFKRGLIPWNKGIADERCFSNKKVIHNGIEYTSVKHLRIQLSMSHSAFYRKIKNGKLKITYVPKDNRNR